MFFRNFSPGFNVTLAVIAATAAIFIFLIVAAPPGVALVLVLISAGLFLRSLHLGGNVRDQSVGNHNIAMTDSRRRRSTHDTSSADVGVIRKALGEARDRVLMMMGFRPAWARGVHGATAT